MNLEVLIGMIASGKSTYARKRAKEGALVICHDDLTQMLHAEYRYEFELRECYRNMEDWLARCALAAGRDVVIDRTHLTAESRRRWVLFQKTCQLNSPDRVSVVAVVFPSETPSFHAYRRFQTDSRGRSYEDWLGVANHHAAQRKAEPLDAFDEGFHSFKEITW